MAGKQRERELRVAMVGAGTALHAMYGPAFRFLEGARLVCVMDPWDEARARAAKEHGLKAYARLEPMIRHGCPDVAIVASPTHAHAGQVLRLARAGVHVFCEKPMARTLAECDEMIQACRQADVHLGVGFMKRFNVTFVLASDLMRRGEIGRLFEMDCEWSFPAGHGPERYEHPHSDWRGHLQNWGGVFQDHGSHTIDLARIWLGEVRSVSARMCSIQPGLPVEDVAAVLCGHQGGGISTHRMNIRTHRPLIERYELFGTGGTLEISWGGVWRWSAYTTEPMDLRLYRAGRERLELTPRPEQSPDLELCKNGQYLNELRAFLAAVRGHGSRGSRGKRTASRSLRAPPVDGLAGRAVVEVITAAYHSAATGRTIELPLTEQVDIRGIFDRGALGLRQ